jgi:ATP synthase protein I
MKEQKPDKLDGALANLSARLEEKNAPPPKEVSSMGMAFRLGSEFTSGVLVGTAFGWFLDDWLGTKPWLLVVCLLFGVAAGVRIMIETLRQYDQQGNEPSTNELEGKDRGRKS